MKRGRVRASQPRIRVQPDATGISLIDAIHDTALFAPWFAKDPASWASWMAFICAAFGLPMDAKQQALYQRCTGRTAPPTEVASTLALICGRRSGKSFILALTSVFLACFHDYRPYLAPGERGTVMIIASDRKQARTILRYIRALLKEVPLLARMIEREVADGFDLSNRVTIEISSASLKSVRGYCVVAALLDEAAFFSTDEGSASPDAEIVAAIKPAMATIPAGKKMLLIASSPYAKRGILWDAYRAHFGKDGDPTLVWQADTRTMNPSVPQSFIDEAYEADPISASAEYGAQFRSDIEQFVSIETVLACVATGVQERLPVSGIKYSAFVDPSGGSADSFTLAIAHEGPGGIATLDAIREVRPKFSPDEVVKEFAALLKTYGISEIIGDKYAAIWPVERFRVHGIEYSQSAAPKSDIYASALPLLNSRTVDLLDHARLISQFVGLERRTSRNGKDTIDHSPGAHDDLVNAVAGVLTNLGTRKYAYDDTLAWIDGGMSEEESNRAWRGNQLAQFMSTPHWGGNRGRRY